MTMGPTAPLATLSADLAPQFCKTPGGREPVRMPITGRGFCDATLTRIRARIHGAPTDAYGLVARDLPAAPGLAWQGHEDAHDLSSRFPPRGRTHRRTADNVSQSCFQPAQQYPRRIVIATTRCRHAGRGVVGARAFSAYPAMAGPEGAVAWVGSLGSALPHTRARLLALGP